MIEIKYGVEPLYKKYEFNKNTYKLLYGYIVSKCYVIKDNIVLFPYKTSNKKIDITTRRKLEDLNIGFNTNYIDELYDDYDTCKKVCNIKNRLLKMNNFELKKIQTIEKVIDFLTTDMCVTEENKILIR